MPTKTLTCKLSDLLAAFQENEDLRYICHAARWLYCQQNSIPDDERFEADSDHTHQELRQMMPAYIRDEAYDSTLTSWTRNMPSHLRLSLCPGRRTYRMKFLRWAINKFGDNTITFKLH